MTNYMVFQVYGILVSWGTQAVGQERPTEDHPGRSALLGLLAAALGIERSDDERQLALTESCRFGVKLLSPGLMLRDFHTTQVPPANKKSRHLYTRRDELREAKLGTILSFRNYQQDALSIVAVSLSGEVFALDDLKQALLQPHFQLYFGRKSCVPAAPLKPKIIPAETLHEAFENYDISMELEHLATNHPRYFWEKGENPGMKAHYQVPRYDEPLSRKRWQFGPRDEYTTLGDE